MTLLDRLDRRFGKYAVPNITLPIIFLQSLAWLLIQAQPKVLERMMFSRADVLAGEWWRLFTFILIPPMDNALFLFFALYMFYLMGTALENQWGSFRYNVYLVISYLASIGGAMITGGYATNLYIGGSVFLAFAWLYPEFTIYVFFILPVQVKWIALFTWMMYGLAFITGGWLTRALVLASVLNFLIFFGKELVLRAKTHRRQMVTRMDRINERDKPFNTCVICGVTEKSNPRMEFRYCGQCAGTPCYCIDHIGTHEHIAAKAG